MQRNPLFQQCFDLGGFAGLRQIVVDCGSGLLVFEEILDPRAGLLELDLLGGFFISQLDDMDSRTGFPPLR